MENNIVNSGIRREALIVFIFVFLSDDYIKKEQELCRDIEGKSSEKPSLYRIKNYQCGQ
jgi:hypothetical protein